MSKQAREMIKIMPRRWILPVAAVLLSAGCADEGAAVPLPTAASSRPASPSPQPEAEAIKHSYAEFIAILDRADSLPANTRRRELAAYMTDPQLSRVLNRVKEMRKEGITAYGSTTGYVKSVHVDRNEAVLLGCQDGSRSGIMHSGTQKKINRGVPKEGVKAYLSKGPDGRWRISKMVSQGEGC
ncbi:hypothetical protein GCM10010182_00180 [Actinomadura cremea]|nr:hypothetical protein GCM10010182_00180 [Actinomadura cremea]